MNVIKKFIDEQQKIALAEDEVKVYKRRHPQRYFKKVTKQQLLDLGETLIQEYIEGSRPWKIDLEIDKWAVKNDLIKVIMEPGE